jgi:hypothetical protein
MDREEAQRVRQAYGKAPGAAPGFDRAALARRYHELCDLRDARYAEAAPLEAKLDAANARCEAARVEALELAAKVEAVWGGESWLALKKEIADIARFFGRVPPRGED